MNSLEETVVVENETNQREEQQQQKTGVVLSSATIWHVLSFQSKEKGQSLPKKRRGTTSTPVPSNAAVRPLKATMWRMAFVKKGTDED